MHILIAGGTGFIGSHLCRHFLRQNHQVSVLTRYPDATNMSAVKAVSSPDPNEQYHIIINLVGEPLNHARWNTATKKSIYDSRITTTQKLVHYIKTQSVKPALFISGSAVGFYGCSEQSVFIENTEPITGDFAQKLCADWESTAMMADLDTRVCIMRTGIVLGNGGFLKAMRPMYQWGLGAKLGQGKQWMSWIHMADVLGMIDFLIAQTTLRGPFNFTTSQPVVNATFTKTLAKILHRPAYLTLPSGLIKLVFGEMGETLLLQGQKVLPNKIIDAGYQFLFPQLDLALKNIISLGE